MAMSLFEDVITILEDRGYTIDEIDLENFLEDITDEKYFALKRAIKKGDQDYIIDFVFDEVPFQLKSSDYKKGGGDMVKKSKVKKVKPTKKVDKGKYTNPDDTFKEMTCPKGAEGGPSSFCGCIRYQMARGLPLENAQALCGYIKKKKYGIKGLYDKFNKDANLEKIARHLSIEKDGIYLSLSLYDLSPGAQEEVLRFLGVKDPDELGEDYVPLFKIPEPEHLESSAYERLMHGNKKKTAQFGEFELYFDDLIPVRQNELLAFFGMNDPSEGNFDVVPIAIVEQESPNLQIPIEWQEGKEGIVGIGSKKEGEKYHPPTTEELKVDPSGSVDVFLSEKTPEKGSDVSRAWEAWCDEKKLSDEAEKGGMGILRGRGFKVSEVEEVTSARKSAFDRFVKKKAQMFYLKEGDKVELMQNWSAREWTEDLDWIDLPIVDLQKGLKGEVVYGNVQGEFHVKWENGLISVEIADVATQEVIRKIGTVKKAWTIEKKKISEGEHKRRLDKIRAYEKDIAREVTQEEADDMYYDLGREGSITTSDA